MPAPIRPKLTAAGVSGMGHATGSPGSKPSSPPCRQRRRLLSAPCSPCRRSRSSRTPTVSSYPRNLASSSPASAMADTARPTVRCRRNGGFPGPRGPRAEYLASRSRSFLTWKSPHGRMRAAASRSPFRAPLSSTKKRAWEVWRCRRRRRPRCRPDQVPRAEAGRR